MLRHNDISNTLSTALDRFKAMHWCEVNVDIDPRPWWQGFYADAAQAVGVSAVAGRRNVNHGLLLPILRHIPRSDHREGAVTPTPRSLRRLRPCANIGCYPLPTHTLITADVGAHTGYT
ncbi:protein of unknown function [Bradyrhizobium vignae]|uniref:Uncharacterized protein n=1 Tax=Bradyrhizobium vignae TaxID=1549949 RepID=A0A2U3QA16_9BRAD|nr:protein of unknown function [Bradyrhizobium vignae]